MTFRAGIGFDIHPLVKNRRLILGGVEIAHSHGLAGHSDADVLTHAVCDALLGAAALGDMGRHFPSSDPKWKDVSSLELLKQVAEMLRQKGLRISNVDATVIAETPRLAAHLERMVEQLALTLSLPIDRVNVKVKSHDALDSIGRGEAIAAQAIALVEK